MSKIIYTNSDGTVSIITPAGDVNDAIKDVPSGLSYEIVEDSAIPTDRSFRNAWKERFNKQTYIIYSACISSSR